jgi:hypothetical protein
VSWCEATEQSHPGVDWILFGDIPDPNFLCRLCNLVELGGARLIGGRIWWKALREAHSADDAVDADVDRNRIGSREVFLVRGFPQADCRLIRLLMKKIPETWSLFIRGFLPVDAINMVVTFGI